MEKKNKKPLVALLLVAVLGVVGVTIAYFSSTDTFANVFGTKAYGVEVVETFESPDDWTPGTTTPKTITVKNTGDIDVAVRVSYTETWKDANNQTLSDTFTNESTGNTERAAIINFADGYATNWTKQGDYYYYKTALGTNGVTSALINSVTFNPNVTGTVNTDNCTTNDETHTITCTTTIGGYAGGRYTLTITAETIQYDQYAQVWTGAPTIAAAPTQTTGSGN